MLYNLTAFLIVLFFLSSSAAGKDICTDVNFKTLVSRADLHYRETVSRSEAGLPLGNGRMGSLIWTSPASLKLQINRVDVFAVNRNTQSFNQRDMDYAAGCGYFDINFTGYGDDVFPHTATRQHLSLYDALLTVNGNGVQAEMLAWVHEDVIAFRIDDQRHQPEPVHVKLRMLRPAEMYTRHHSAISRLFEQNGYIVLTQTFKEGDFYCRSAVVAAVSGRAAKARLSDATGGRIPIQSSKTWRLNRKSGQPSVPGLGQATQTEIQLITPPAKGRFEVLVASAASFDPQTDVVASAVSQLEAAQAKGFDSLLNDNREWWHAYWSRAFVHLHSPDGIADEIEKNYTYYLYLMAASSRGDFAPDFSGMIWKTRGDASSWGSQQWWNNLSMYYRGFLPANRLDVMQPLFNHYSGMYDACSTAARQMWDSKGIFIPETVWFDGPPDIPDEIAAEMQDLYLVRKPWHMRSRRFREYAVGQNPLTSTWNWKGRGYWKEGRWMFSDKGKGPFGSVLHLFESGAKIAFLYWKCYEYTGDKVWLKEHAYPVIRGVTEFYRNFPNTFKESDGKYHIHLINDREGLKGVRDGIESMTAMHGLLPVALKASELLNADHELRQSWKEFYDNLAPLPCSDHPDYPFCCESGTPFWVGGLRPFVAAGSGQRHLGPNLAPIAFFDYCSLESRDHRPDIWNTAIATYEKIHPDGIDENTKIHILLNDALAAAKLGRAQDVRFALPSLVTLPRPQEQFCDFEGTGRTGVLPNRMSLREGVNAIGAQRLGNAACTLHEALVQSNPPAPAQQPVIRVFPAWPKEWDAEFSLLCRGGFLVSASQKNGSIDFVKIKSQNGGPCLIRNPWENNTTVQVSKHNKTENMSGSLLSLDTEKGELIVLKPGILGNDDK